jgi:hypothetical protein
MMNPGPNNRALTTGGDDPKGGAILKITFAGLLSCSGENKLPKCALPHRPNSPGRATLLQRTVDLTLTPPDCSAGLCSRARLPCTPVVADSGRAALHRAALSFQANGSASHRISMIDALVSVKGGVISSTFGA